MARAHGGRRHPGARAGEVARVATTNDIIVGLGPIFWWDKDQKQRQSARTTTPPGLPQVRYNP